MIMEPPRLLLVEDDAVFAQVVGRVLQQRNYEVLHAQDCEQAEGVITGNVFNYAILDLNLAGQSSLRLIAPLKRRNPAIRILILTGYASITSAVEAIKLGANNYLAKPADADEILTALLPDREAESRIGDETSALEPMSVRRLEWEHLQKVLSENDGNISETARHSKMHRRTLQRKLQKRPVAK